MHRVGVGPTQSFKHQHVPLISAAPLPSDKGTAMRACELGGRIRFGLSTFLG